MARPPKTDRTRQRILSLARKLLQGTPGGETIVIVTPTEVEVIRDTRPSEQAKLIAATAVAIRDYDMAILSALTDTPVSAERLARAANHRPNSHFRQRLAALVDQGHIRHSRSGYRLPDK